MVQEDKEQSLLKRVLVILWHGLRNNIAYYGIVIGSTQEIFIQNHGIAYGSIELQSSFRSEIFGMLSGCHLLSLLVNYYQSALQPNQQLSIFCDNLGLIKRVNKHLSGHIPLRDYGLSDTDVELQLLHELKVLQVLGFTVTVQHVKGHQDSTQ